MDKDIADRLYQLELENRNMVRLVNTLEDWSGQQTGTNAIQTSTSLDSLGSAFELELNNDSPANLFVFNNIVGQMTKSASLTGTYPCSFNFKTTTT